MEFSWFLENQKKKNKNRLHSYEEFTTDFSREQMTMLTGRKPEDFSSCEVSKIWELWSEGVKLHLEPCVLKC